MPNLFQNLNLSVYPLSVILLKDNFFLQYLDCDFFVSGLVDSNFDFPKGTFSDGLFLIINLRIM